MGAGTVHEEHVAVAAEDQVNELVNIATAYNGVVWVLDCDGAAVNTGTLGRVCRLFDLIKEKTVHWFACQIHSNELNFRKVFQELDDRTTGPKSWITLESRQW